jgi:hypothetical protein
MTSRTSVVCAICETESVQAAGASPTDPPAAADFDTRPAEPLRSTIGGWIQACPNCGYCADDISRTFEGIAEIVGSSAYRSYLEDTSMPVLARSFLCYSCLLERLHQHADAGWSALHAAWACDDAGHENAAIRCRSRAIALWRTAKAAGQQFADNLASEFALATDVYRRMKEFEHATVTCAEGLDLEDIQPTLEQVLRRQMILIQRRDSSAHSMAELTAC